MNEFKGLMENVERNPLGMGSILNQRELSMIGFRDMKEAKAR
jgi:hypothetical protein